jgi:iron(III) transport system permease protein
MPRRRFLPVRPDGFAILGAVVVVLVLAPVVALVIIAGSGGEGPWRHLFVSVVPKAALETAILVTGVAVFAGVVGTAAAWLVAVHDFPGRRLLEPMLLLPLAFPVYVLAYSWLDLLHPIGPLQTALRAVLGYARPADLRLPDLRSLPGAILIFGSALYPYVYVAVRAVFLSQTTGLVEAARTLGAGRARVFFRVALPLARPAIGAGMALVVMETLNDVGAAEFLSVNTLTAAVYSTWVNRGDLPGAAQIALAMLLFVGLALFLERAGRGNRGYAVVGRGGRRGTPIRVDGAAGVGLFLLGSLPALLGFGLPALHLARQAGIRLAEAGLPMEILAEVVNTVSIAAVTTLLAVAVALPVVAGRRLHPGSRLHDGLTRLSVVGYAIPGTILGIGLLTVYGAIDGAIRGAVVGLGGAPTGLVVSASVGGLVLAHAIRFFRLGVGKIDTGLERISPSLDQSARMLGRTPFGVLRHVHLPLLTPAMAGAGPLLFVDCMKELPATLLLRPLGFETLSTRLYGEAARGTYENGALAACLIVAFGLLPIVAMLRIGRRPPAPVESGEPTR